MGLSASKHLALAKMLDCVTATAPPDVELQDRGARAQEAAAWNWFFLDEVSA
jgi:hypothetical protein